MNHSTSLKAWVADSLPSQVRQWLWQRKVAFGNRRARELHHHLSTRIHQFAQQDLALFDRIDCKAEWECFRDERIGALRQMLEIQSEQRPSNILSVTKKIERPSYRIDHIVFSGYMDFPVTANLYWPLRPDRKVPAIVICHSHHAPKTELELQCMGMTWAMQGCVVLILDLLGHGERRQHPFHRPADFHAAYRVHRQDYYFRSVCEMQLGLVGESLMGWMVQDMRRGIDVLWSNPQIDRNRIIVVGSVAGGGDIAAIVGATDDRIAAVIAFNFGSLSTSDWDLSRNLPGTVRFRFWPWIILASLAPRRLIYGREFSWNPDEDLSWHRLEKIYELYNSRKFLRSVHGSGKVSSHMPDDTHCMNVGFVHRRQVYPILKEWFEIPVPDQEAFDFLERRCLDETIVSTDRPKAQCTLNEHILSIGQARLAAAREEREAAGTGGEAEQLRQELLAVLGLVDPFTSYRVKEAHEGFGRAKNVVLEVEEKVFVRLRLYWPSKCHRSRLPVVIGLTQEGNARLYKERRKLIQKLLAHEVVVCLAELRGIGDARHGELYRGRLSPSAGVAATSQMLGEPVIISRIRDVRTVIAYLSHHHDLALNQIGLWGDSLAGTNSWRSDLDVPLDTTPFPHRGEPLGGVVAALTALYEPNVRAVYVHRGLVSYASILQSPFTYQPMDSLIPGMLRIADLPDIAAALAPRPLRLEGLVDGQNRHVTVQQLEQSYARARKAYEQKGQSDYFGIQVKKSTEDSIATWFQSCLSLSITSE